jgi:hypothetical protein
MNIRAKIFGGVSAVEESLLKPKRPKGAKAEALDSVKVSRETSRTSNDRGEDRHRLTDERATLTYKGKQVEVELINLSGGGAMVSAGFMPNIWDYVLLHLGNHGTIECAVRWIRNDRVGLEFAHETRLDGTSDQVAIVLRHVIEKTFPHVSFPQTEATEPTPVVEPRISEHREAPRHPLIWNGMLHHDYQSDAVRIRNISETGAMIEIAGKVRVGAEPLLDLGEAASLSATVEWAVGDQVGLRFHSPFDMNLLADTRPTVASHNWTPPAYLKGTSGEQDRWGRLNLAQLHDQLEGFLRH